MIGQLTAVEAYAQADAVAMNPSKRSFHRFMARCFGVSSVDVGLPLDMVASIGEGKKAAVYERMVKLVDYDVKSAVEHCVSDHFEMTTRKRSPKYGTLTYQFRVLKAPQTSQEYKWFCQELKEILGGFCFLENHAEHFQ